MYDAQQGSTSGAHIDMSTASGTNDIHGSAYLHRGTDWLNAAPFFYKQDGNIPADEKVPGLHREVPGGTLGGPIIKNKLFGFVSYQHIHDSDQEIGTSRIAVPEFLTNDRSPPGLAQPPSKSRALCVANPPVPPCQRSYCRAHDRLAPQPSRRRHGSGQINPIAYGLLNYKLPNGQYLIPSADGFTPTLNFPENTFITRHCVFPRRSGGRKSRLHRHIQGHPGAQVLLSARPQHRSLRLFRLAGFHPESRCRQPGGHDHEHADTDADFNVAEVFGFIREKVYSTIQQPFTPQSLLDLAPQLPQTHGHAFTPADTTINTFGSTFFPGMSIVDDYGNTPN